jgi:four helix bundle protein
MATINCFEELNIWKEARRLFKIINHIILETDLNTDFKLRDQIKASSGSVMDNIAEGFERGGNIEFRQFLSIAKGSAGETRSQLYRIYDCDYISEKQLEELVGDYKQLSKKIASLMNYLNKKEYKGLKFKQQD